MKKRSLKRGVVPPNVTATLPGEQAPLTHYGAADLAALMYQHCWKTHQENITAIAIALAESGGDIHSENHNTNGTVDKGLWQVNSVHGFPGDLFDPKYNLLAACSVYKSQGFNAWSTYKNGAYRQFIPEAEKGLGEFHRQTGGKVGPHGELLGGQEGAESLLEPFGGKHSEGAAEGAVKAAGTALSWTTDLAKVLGFLTHSSSWLRIGKVVIGSALLIIALDQLSKLAGGPSVPAADSIRAAAK